MRCRSAVFAFAIVVVTASTTGADDLFRFGGMRDTLAMGQHQARVRLDDVAREGSVYAVGALESLAGEVTILDSEVITTAKAADGALRPLDGSDRSATMLVGARVFSWSDHAVDAAIAPDAFDAAIRAAALAAGVDATTPFSFLVEGTVTDVHLHVIHGACPMHARRNGIELGPDQRPFEMKTAAIRGTIVGVYAEDAAGQLTHPDTSVHAHLVYVDEATGDRVTGHLESRGIGAGSTIRVPRRD